MTRAELEAMGEPPSSVDYLLRQGQTVDPAAVLVIEQFRGAGDAALVRAARAVGSRGGLPAWDCAHCGQKNSGWADECGRCERPKKIRAVGERLAAVAGAVKHRDSSDKMLAYLLRNYRHEVHSALVAMGWTPPGGGR